jgi:glycosyltransferase involved in cell wall biosynthesis
MRLLLLDQFSDMGGAQHGFFDLIPAIRQRGWQALAGLPGDGELFHRVRDAGFEVRKIICGPYRSGGKSLGDMVRFAAGTPQLARQIRDMISGWNASLLYVNGPRLLPATALVRPRIPVLFHSHSFLPPGSSRTLAERSLRKLDAWVLGVCNFVTDPWRPFVRPERISIIYNGVAVPEGFRRKPRRGPPRIGCIGRISPEKGQIEFLAAAKTIHEQFPEAEFAIYGDVLFGDQGAMRYAGEVRAMAAGLPVEFAGWVKNVFDALATLDLVLVPSKAHEATTRVILEAFGAGVPVVAMRSGGIPEVIEHGRNGYLAGSVAEMADLSIEVLRSQADLSEAARDSWQRRFRLDRYRDEVCGLLEKITANQTAR